MKAKNLRKLPRFFYERSTDAVARELLGKVLILRSEDRLCGRIVETEAYTDDEASHAHRGRTFRNEPMFGTAGYAYVYFIYGMYHCLNVVTERPGVPGAVLIRAVEPLAGVEAMMNNRPNRRLNQLTSGPGKLCQAFGITAVHNGWDFTRSELSIADDGYRASRVARSTRIGIRRAAEEKRRYFLPHHPFLSA